jgi:hypothetical protein
LDYQEPIETDPLAEPMRREAQRLRPEFSAALDARLRAAIRAGAVNGPHSAVRPSRKLGRPLASWAAAAAAAAALLVGSALVCHTLGRGSAETIAQSMPPERAEPPTDDIDSTAAVVENTANDLGRWMAITVDDNQWAGLDHDAQTAVAAVTGSLPFDLAAAP